MSEQGFCPTCGIPWPNFCPIDGKRLNGAWTCANAPKPVIRPAAPVAAPAPAPAAIAPSDDTLEMDPVARKAVPSARQAPAPAPKPQPKPEPAPVAAEAEPEAAPAPLRRAPDPSLMRSFVENVGSRSGERGAGRRLHDPRAAATVIQPQLTEEEIAKAKQRAAERAAQAASAEPTDDAAKQKKKRDGFSDTQWFMKGLSLEVADPDTGAVVVDESDYQVDESIPETERRKFTLRKKGEE